VTAPAPPRDTRRLRLALAISLGLNLLLAAFVGGSWWRIHHVPHVLPATLLQTAGGKIAERIFERVILGLSAADADTMRQAIDDHMDEIIAAQSAFLVDMAKVRADVAAPVVNVAALRTDVEAARRSRQLLGPVIERIILEGMPKLSLEGRRRLAAYRG